MNRFYIIGIDGGATTTTGVIFDNYGKTLGTFKTKGTNLNIYKELAVERVTTLIKKLSNSANVALQDIHGFGIALAGISDLDQRDNLLKGLDAMNISSKSIVLSDAEAAYRVLCPSGTGILMSIGTGIVGIGKNDKKTFKVAGKGHNNGDLGSGYWIGKQLFKNLLINSNIIKIDDELSDLFNIVKKRFNISNIHSLSQKLEENIDSISDIASISVDIINKAQFGNDLALSIIQEATTYVAEYINYMFDALAYSKHDVIIACNGSIIKNEFYRKLLSDALQFEFNKIHWVFTDISSAYGAGLIISELKGGKISSSDFIKGLHNA